MEEATAAHRPLEFRRGHSLHNDKVRRAPRWTGQIQAGRGGRLMELGVHAGEWIARRARCAAGGAKAPKKKTHILIDFCILQLYRRCER
jgi:hypothetical protein